MSAGLEKILCMTALALCLQNSAYAQDNAVISQMVEADACDDRQQDFDKQTMEYRAVDKASLIAVKSAGIIQKYGENLTPSVVDIIAYRLIDEYLANVEHNITLSEVNRVCVHVSANLEISADELKSLIKEHKKAAEPAHINPDAEVKMATEVAEEVKQKTAFKPQNLKEKKLVYIENMKFWDDTDTNHYTDFLKEKFSHSDYYFVTDDKSLADFVIEPALTKAEVDKIDDTNHKMQMVVVLQTIAQHNADFKPLKQEQNHFVLFAADKDEQQMADNLIMKLLTRAAADANGKINRFLQDELEKNKIIGKK